MLETLSRTVKDECESEFIHSSDTAALLLRQMMQQVRSKTIRNLKSQIFENFQTWIVIFPGG